MPFRFSPSDCWSVHRRQFGAPVSQEPIGHRPLAGPTFSGPFLPIMAVANLIDDWI